jgi:alpha-1,3-rhamnosyl/mannosyltransferase
MNLCLDARTATPHFPGIGRYVRNLVRSLPAFLGSDERLVVLHDDKVSLVNEITRPQVRLRAVPWSPFSWQQQIRVPQPLQALEIDLYHSPYYLMPYRSGRPTVLTVYDLIPLLFSRATSPRARLLFRMATGLALQNAAHALAISETTRQDYLQVFHLRPEKIEAIPLAAEDQFHPQSQAEIERVLDKFNLKRYALYVGINKPHKNITRLVEAWGTLVKQGASEGTTLVIGGAWDPRYPEPRQRAFELGLNGSIRFLGPLAEDDLPGLYAGSALFVFPSLYEGFGLPVLEAMACGTPVVCARTSSLVEIAEGAAELFDPHSTNGMAASIQKVLEDESLRRDLQERGAKRTAEYSWARTAQETLAAYRRQVRTEN